MISILILSSIISAASSYAVVSMHNLNQSILVDNGARAFYAAESGIEDALYEIRKIESPVSSLASSGSLSNFSSWSRSILPDIGQMTFDIKKNDFEYIDLYDPDSSLSPLDIPIKSLKLSWTGNGAEWVQVQVVPWLSDGTLGEPFEQHFSASSNPAIVNLQSGSNVLYRVRIKALYSDIQDMSVEAYSELNTGGNKVNIPGFLTIISNGSFSRASQSITAQMPQRGALSGQFGYVLFSEEDLVK